MAIAGIPVLICMRIYTAADGWLSIICAHLAVLAVWRTLSGNVRRSVGTGNTKMPGAVMPEISDQA